jgi:hypothetical protein
MHYLYCWYNIILEVIKSKLLQRTACIAGTVETQDTHKIALEKFRGQKFLD